jgi:hypothetical protein
MFDGLVDRLALKHRESLRTYLALLGDMSVADIIRFCGEYGHMRWAEVHLLPEYERRRREHKTGDGDRGKEIIESYLLQWMPSRDQIIGQLDRIETNEMHLAFQLELLSEAFLRRGDSGEVLCDIA